MIAGIGTDIAEVKRFEKWVKNPEMIERFFNEMTLDEVSSYKASQINKEVLEEELESEIRLSNDIDSVVKNAKPQKIKVKGLRKNKNKEINKVVLWTSIWSN